MPRTEVVMTFRPVRAIGLKLPGVEESTMYGSPALKLGGRLIACMASHKSAEPDGKEEQTSRGYCGRLNSPP